MLKEFVKKRFLIVTPLIILLGAGVLTKTYKKASIASACSTNEYTGLIKIDESLAYFNGREVRAPKIADSGLPRPVLGVADPSERWIEIDLSDQKLRAWDGSKLFLETAVSSGLPGTPTPKGEFRIWVKLRATKMEGGQGSYYYYLPNVPYVMYFGNSKVPNSRGYGLHGTYWHNDFGNPRSHGCVNLPTPIAEKLYSFVGPIIPEGKSSVYASQENIGTRIIIHD